MSHINVYGTVFVWTASLVPYCDLNVWVKITQVAPSTIVVITVRKATEDGLYFPTALYVTSLRDTLARVIESATIMAVIIICPNADFPPTVAM